MSAPVVGRVEFGPAGGAEVLPALSPVPSYEQVRKERDFHEKAATALNEIGQQMAEALQDVLAESRPCRSTHSRICKCSIQRLLNLWAGR